MNPRRLVCRTGWGKPRDLLFSRRKRDLTMHAAIDSQNPIFIQGYCYERFKDGLVFTFSPLISLISRDGASSGNTRFWKTRKSSSANSVGSVRNGQLKPDRSCGLNSD